ncbi:MAG: helix-turn-helix domain-containing protein [Burkholderiaceae bacterium]
MLVKSAQRVLELLELFESECRPLRVGEIVQRIDMPQSSVSMLLKTLAARGYMEYDALTRTYCPSIRVAFLGDWTARLPGQQEGVRTMMRQLAEETGETVLLGRQSGLFMQYVSMIESNQALRLTLPPGTVRPMHRTAIGIMLLSRQSDEQVGRILRRYNAEHSHDLGAVRVAEVIAQIESARRDGHFVSESLATPGSGVVAALLTTRIRGQYLGVGVGGPLPRILGRRAALIDAVKRLARMC